MANDLIRSYSKSQLALMYFPDSNSSHSAVNLFMSRLNRYPDIIQELEKMGYRKTDKIFTPRMVAYLFEELGEPSSWR